jgi:hypothetical protein
LPSAATGSIEGAGGGTAARATLAADIISAITHSRFTASRGKANSIFPKPSFPNPIVMVLFPALFLLAVVRSAAATSRKRRRFAANGRIGRPSVK